VVPFGELVRGSD